jgi:hypothetical protein
MVIVYDRSGGDCVWLRWAAGCWLREGGAVDNRRRSPVMMAGGGRRRSEMAMAGGGHQWRFAPFDDRSQEPEGYFSPKGVWV